MQWNSIYPPFSDVAVGNREQDLNADSETQLVELNLEKQVMSGQAILIAQGCNIELHCSDSGQGEFLGYEEARSIEAN